MIIEELVIQVGASLSDTMRCINKNSQGLCLILDGNLLVGVVTDGDLRRSMLRGATLTDAIESIMNRNFFCLPVDSTFELIQKMMNITNVPSARAGTVRPTLSKFDTLVSQFACHIGV